MNTSETDPQGTITDVLEETGSMVTIVELQSFMHQALARGEALATALERCFEGPVQHNATPSQAKRFRSAVELMWAQEAERFDPVSDARIAGVRDETLNGIKRISGWIRSLDVREIDLSELPREEMARLGRLSGMLGSLLDVIQRDADADTKGLMQLHEQLRALMPIIDEEIGNVEGAIERGDVAPEEGADRLRRG